VQEEQLSLFAALSAVAIGGHEPEWVSEEHDGAADPIDDVDGGDDADLVVVLAPPPLPGGGADGHHRTRREHKAHLRLENSERARDIARRTGLTHAQVNAELNRLSSVGRVSEATVAQLERRLAQADRWLARL
jgi:hypothetical protein